jgi:dTDP-4-amino-4,6-dideoxygalactose transaminase
MAIVEPLTRAGTRALSVKIPLYKPFVAPNASAYVNAAIGSGELSGNGSYSHFCEAALESMIGCHKAFLSQSCTSALETAAIALDLKPGDEVIMPSFTFPSTANAFALRGAVPVFVDVRRDTLNIDERLIESAITERTRAIVVVHYGGVACAMSEILAMADKYGVGVIEDAAHALGAGYAGRPLGSFGQMAAISFHETKNISCGEGGALIINNPIWKERVAIARQAGTNRDAFRRGAVPFYTWLMLGIKDMPGELTAAFLAAQLECVHSVTAARLALWQRYFDGLKELASGNHLILPGLTEGASHNAHIFYVICASAQANADLHSSLAADGIEAATHYVPLHLTRVGQLHGRAAAPLTITESLAPRLLRLPLYVGLSDSDQARVVAQIYKALA